MAEPDESASGDLTCSFCGGLLKLTDVVAKGRALGFEIADNPSGYVIGCCGHHVIIDDDEKFLRVIDALRARNSFAGPR